MNVTRRLEEEFIKKAIETIQQDFIGYEREVLSYAAKFLLLISKKLLGAEDFSGKSGLSTFTTHADRVVKVNESNNSPLLIIYYKLTDSLAALSQPKKSLSEVRKMLTPKVLIGIAEEYINNTIGTEISDNDCVNRIEQAINDFLNTVLGGKKKVKKIEKVYSNKLAKNTDDKLFVKAKILNNKYDAGEGLFILENSKVRKFYNVEAKGIQEGFHASVYIRDKKNNVGVSREEVLGGPKQKSIYQRDGMITVCIDYYYKQDYEEAEVLSEGIVSYIDLGTFIEPIVTVKLVYHTSRDTPDDVSHIDNSVRGR